MTTPTDPTTPQPKPAGLRTCFHCGTDLSSLPNDVFCPKCLPVPATPHAAEAGVRDVRLTGTPLDALLPNPDGSESETARVFREAREAEDAYDARHRPAAETVGTGADHYVRCQSCNWQGLWSETGISQHVGGGVDRRAVCPQCQAPGNFVSTPPTPPATQSALDEIAQAVGFENAAAVKEGLPALVRAIVADKHEAETKFAATQSALEQARSGMEDMIRTLKTVPANMARPALCEGDFIRWDKALAALNAVLPPAKGGDGV